MLYCEFLAYFMLALLVGGFISDNVVVKILERRRKR